MGKLGEQIAARYLSSLGFIILAQNFKKRYGEIDIVAREGKTLVFVEVKTRKGTKYGTAEEAITPWKLHSLIKSAEYYLLLHPKLPRDWRIDAVSVYLSPEERLEKISLYRNITM